jgi:DNA replication protein
MGAPRFAGFPDGRLEATVVPSLFFTEVLGQIDDLAELKLVLYLFWRFGKKKEYPRFVTRRELENETVIQAGIAGFGDDALAVTLDRLVNRGVLLRRSMELNREPEECYFLNTASGRKAVSDLESGRLDLGHVVLPESTSRRPDRPNIFDLYEQNIGLLTPLIVDELREAERLYPGEWIEEAFRQAVSYNRRSWKYVQRILERWAVEGKRDEAGGRRSPRPRYP